MTYVWPRKPTDSVVDLRIQRWYGSVPTVFGAPAAESAGDLRGTDIVFLGIPWQAPVPDSRVGAGGAAYHSLLTPQNFRINSIKYGGYLPELDVDIFQHLTLKDYGNADVSRNLQTSLATVERMVDDIIGVGAIPITMGGNSGVSTLPVIKAISKHAKGPIAVINLDAHGDNHEDVDISHVDNRQPRWGGTWASLIFDFPRVSPSHYHHVGLRGPRNDAGTIPRFLSRGVLRKNIYTHREIKAARKNDFDAFAADIAKRAVDGAEHVWLALDLDVLDMSASPDYGDEPLGISVDEMTEICFQVGRYAGRSRLAGLSFMAIPPDAVTMQWIAVYAIHYTLAGMIKAVE